MTPLKRIFVFIGFSAWMSAAGYFAVRLMAFDGTPGIAARAPENWPKESSIRHVVGRKTLVMFIHPECACSRASLQQLALLGQMLGKQVDRQVVIWHGKPGTIQAEQTGGAVISYDREGTESLRFDARTSGQTVVYDETGRLIYSGGLTVFRGEAGGEKVMQVIIQSISGRERDARAKPVFGCPIIDRFEPRQN